MMDPGKTEIPTLAQDVEREKPQRRMRLRQTDIVLDPAVSRQVRRQAERIRRKQQEQETRRKVGPTQTYRAGPNKAILKARPRRERDSKYTGDFAAAMTSVSRLRRFKDVLSRHGGMVRLA